MVTYKYWQYFLALEDDLARSTRFVEVAEDNFATYSVEYARLLLSTGSEVDVVCTLLAAAASPGMPAGNIVEYRQAITTRYPKLYTTQVLVPRYALRLIPWQQWGSVTTPSWWSRHTEVKHHRDQHYREANLRNALNAMAALFVAVLYLHRSHGDADELSPAPQLFHLEVEPGHLLDECDYGLLDFP